MAEIVVPTMNILTFTPHEDARDLAEVIIHTGYRKLNKKRSVIFFVQLDWNGNLVQMFRADWELLPMA